MPRPRTIPATPSLHGPTGLKRTPVCARTHNAQPDGVGIATGIVHRPAQTRLGNVGAPHAEPSISEILPRPPPNSPEYPDPVPYDLNPNDLLPKARSAPIISPSRRQLWSAYLLESSRGISKSNTALDRGAHELIDYP